MNPGIGAPELIVLVILALVVVGPKDLPLLMRKAGRFLNQMRGLARDFQRSFDELGREAELAELRKEIAALKDAGPVGEAAQAFRDAEADLRASADFRDAPERPHPRLAETRAESRAEPEPAPRPSQPLDGEMTARAPEPAPAGGGRDGEAAEDRDARRRAEGA